VKARWGTADISNIKVQGADSPGDPFVYTFHIRVEGYAQRTGKRLFLSPSFFRVSEPVMFTAAERIHPIYFHYPWSEEDNITIELPPGFELDNPEGASPFKFPPVGEYTVSTAISKDKKVLIYSRKLVFGSGDQILFPAKTYPMMKQIFERIHEADTHTLSLKLVEATQ
jgi:hypothetical protein